MTDAREEILLASIEALEDQLEKLRDERDEMEAGGKDTLDVQECIRCHRAFTGPVGQKWCTHDCRMGWTVAPTYEDWYASMHPRSRWLRTG